MKKYLVYLLAFIMIFTALSVLSSVSLSAADDDFDSDEYGVPDDAFDGKYTEFKGKDGSVTKVFDNGSVKTTYKDGTAEGVDYMGNHHSLNKDGDYTVRTTDGYSTTAHNDGRYSQTEPGGGKITTVYPDEHMTEDYPSLGISVETDSNGRTASIGFIGGSEKIECDEYGCYKSGEIKGPNGEKLKITETGITFTNAKGDEYEHIETGNKKKTTIKWKDGSHCESETTSTWKNGELTEDTDFSLTESNGNKWEANVSITYDDNGYPYYSDNDVTQFTGTDGSTFRVDNNSGAMEYKDKDGTEFTVDDDGNLTDYKDKDNDWKVTYNYDGTVKTAEITYKDGAKMVQKADGSASFTLPDGTKYESDGKGNVYKDGTQIKKNGEWVPKEEETSGSDKTKPGESGGKTPTWLNGTWSKTEYKDNWEIVFTRESVRLTVLNDHTLLYEEYYYYDFDHPSFPWGVDYSYEREYTYDPKTETVIISATDTGLIVGQVYDWSETSMAKTSLNPVKIVKEPAKDNYDCIAARFFYNPKELGGTSTDSGNIRYERSAFGEEPTMKVKNVDFFGVTLPFPDIGTITENETKADAWGDESATVRIDGITYAQYKEYCKILEDLYGWEVYEGDYPEDVAHMPEDYNSRSKVYFTGSYSGLPHISVQYYSDSTAGNKYPNFCMFVFKDWS